LSVSLEKLGDLDATLHVERARQQFSTSTFRSCAKQAGKVN
jgi:hypothetical protein